MRVIVLGTLIVTTLGACATPDPPPPPRSPAGSWVEARTLLWNGYFAATPGEIATLRGLDGYDDCDMLFMLMVCRHARASLREVVREYNRVGGSLYETAAQFEVDDEELLPDEVSPEVPCPPPYDRVVARRRGVNGRAWTNEECRALVDLRIGIDYYGYRAEEYFSRYDSLRRQGEGHPFRSMAAADIRRAGSGPKTAVGRLKGPPKAESVRGEIRPAKDTSRKPKRPREAVMPPPPLARSRTSTSAPACRAPRAAEMPAAPRPATTTSASSSQDWTSLASTIV